MADLARDFGFLVRSADRSIAQLRGVAERRPSTTGRGAVLRGHLTAALDAVTQRVTRSKARFSAASSDVEWISLIDSLRLLNRYLTGIQEAAPWLAAADAPTLHIGLLYFLDEAARALVGADSEVVTAADAKYQYATVSWPFRPIAPVTSGAPRPIIIFYPPQDADSFLLHTLFAHELGHPAIDERGLLQQVLASHIADAAFMSDFDNAAQDLAARTNAPVPGASITLRTRLNNWTTELLCDALAIEYLGPSFVFAFAAVVLAVSWNEPQERHPPTTLRVSLMLKQLDDRGWTDCMRSRIPNTYDWLQDVATTALATPSVHEQFLTGAAQRVSADVRASAAAALGHSAYRRSDYEAVSAEIDSFLRLRILPAQRHTGEAFDRRSILLAGWLYMFRANGDAPTSIPKGVSNDEFQEFIATALEMSSILETWRQI